MSVGKFIMIIFCKNIDIFKLFSDTSYWRYMPIVIWSELKPIFNACFLFLCLEWCIMIFYFVRLKKPIVRLIFVHCTNEIMSKEAEMFCSTFCRFSRLLWLLRLLRFLLPIRHFSKWQGISHKISQYLTWVGVNETATRYPVDMVSLSHFIIIERNVKWLSTIA